MCFAILSNSATSGAHHRSFRTITKPAHLAVFKANRVAEFCCSTEVFLTEFFFDSSPIHANNKEDLVTHISFSFILFRFGVPRLISFIPHTSFVIGTTSTTKTTKNFIHHSSLQHEWRNENKITKQAEMKSARLDFDYDAIWRASMWNGSTHAFVLEVFVSIASRHKHNSLG